MNIGIRKKVTPTILGVVRMHLDYVLKRSLANVQMRRCFIEGIDIP
jgi:hypothetical protein